MVRPVSTSYSAVPPTSSSQTSSASHSTAPAGTTSQSRASSQLSGLQGIERPTRGLASSSKAAAAAAESSTAAYYDPHGIFNGVREAHLAVAFDTSSVQDRPDHPGLGQQYYTPNGIKPTSSLQWDPKTTLPAHITLMSSLPAELSRQNRSHIHHFLCHLEEHSRAWSELDPVSNGGDSTALQQAVNAGIRDHGLHSSTRAALNQAFGLLMQAESGRVRLTPTRPEHIALMRRLPAGLNASYRSRINRFLCHLEEHSRAWSELDPVSNGGDSTALQQAVNAGIRDHGLHAGTRTALNQAFELLMQPE